MPVKLQKQAFPEGRARFDRPDGDEHGFTRPRADRPDHSAPESGQAQADEDSDSDQFSPPPPPEAPVRDILRELRPELKELGQNLGQNINQKVVDQLQREITILRERNGASRQTKLDLEDAKIIIRDDKGELELKSDAGKRFLTAKDAQGKLLFSGPVNTPEERKAVPADILPRLDKLEKEDVSSFPEAPKADGAANTSPNGPSGARVPLSAQGGSF